MAAAREALEKRLAVIDGVSVSDSMFGHGDAYWVNGKEVAHLEGDEVIEVRLTRSVIRERRSSFKADQRVELRPSGADWLTVRFTTDDDVEFVVELVTIAAAAHAPPPGTPPRLPPTGPALERRQRFH